jgi:hypothetical protein
VKIIFQIMPAIPLTRFPRARRKTTKDVAFRVCNNSQGIWMAITEVMKGIGGESIPRSKSREGK